MQIRLGMFAVEKRKHLRMFVAQRRKQLGMSESLWVQQWLLLCFFCTLCGGLRMRQVAASSVLCVVDCACVNFKTLTRRPKTAKTLGRKRSQLCISISTTHVLSGRAWALSVRVDPAPRLCSLQESEIMLFAGVRAGVRARALSGSTPDDGHETLCGCLCLCVYSSSIYH